MRQAFHFTTHAVEQFIRRVQPGAPPVEALAALHAAANEAIQLAERTLTGEALWLVKFPRMRLVTKQADNGTVVITVLAGHDGGDAEAAVDDVVGAYRRLRAHPELGAAEDIRPCDGVTPHDCRTWAHVETQRLLTERRRLEALAAVSTAARDRVRASQVDGLRELLREAEAHLATVDPRGSVPLLAKIDRALRRQP
jgi:hypothetical protein